MVHEAAETHMNFVTKNFRYVTKPFGDFIEQLRKGSKQYLRSLAASKPTETPANISIDFPELSPDFCLPPQLEQVAQKAHSSPLRISGPVTMWLHYDVSYHRQPKCTVGRTDVLFQGHGQCPLPNTRREESHPLSATRCQVSWLSRGFVELEYQRLRRGQRHAILSGPYAPSSGQA